MFFLLFIFSGYSQKIKLGFELNPGLSWCKENSKIFDNQMSKFAIDGGLSMENYFANNYAFYSGVKLSVYSFKLLFLENADLYINGDLTNINAGDKINFKLQYINIPLGLKMKTNQIGYFSYYINLGLNSFFNIKSTIHSNFFDNESVSKEINPINIGYFVSAGIEYNVVGETNLVLGLKFNNGFVDIFKRKNSHETLNYILLTTEIIF